MFTKKIFVGVPFLQVPGLGLATVLKKELWHRCFPLILVKFLRTAFYRTTAKGCFWTLSGVMEKTF